MNKRYKQLFRKFCLDTNFLGLKYLYLYRDPLSRCFWFVSLISVLWFAFFLTYLLYMRFMETPTRISVENQYASAINISYPSIVLCSPNQVTIRAMEELNRTFVTGRSSIDLKKVLPRLLGYYRGKIDLYDNSDFIELSKLIESNRYHITQVMALLPQRCEEFLKVCVFENVIYPKCERLFYPILTNLGLCCAFNNNYEFKGNKRNERKTTFHMRNLDKIGLSGSLIVTTDYDPDSAIDGSIVDSGASRVSVIQPSDFPDVENAKLVPSNLESFNFIHPTYTYLSDDVAALPLSSRNCYSRDEITVRFFHEYSKSDCDLLCEVEEIERRCHCLMIYVPHVKTKLACNTTDINCIISVKTKYSEWFNEEKCHCPRDCSSFEYRIEATLGNLLSVRQIAHNMYGYLNLNKSSTILHFNIPRTVYVRQRQETVMSLITLCSNLGGVFGLCMGCSAVSLFEILYYLYIAIKMRMENKRTRRMRKERNTWITYLQALIDAHA